MPLHSVFHLKARDTSHFKMFSGIFDSHYKITVIISSESNKLACWYFGGDS